MADTIPSRVTSADKIIVATSNPDSIPFDPFDELLPDVEVVAVPHSSEIIMPQILGGEELQGLSAHNVADALRYFSGVQLKDYGGVGGIKTLDIRSMGTNHLGVFYDGLPLGNAQNGQIDLGKYSLDNIEEIALYNAQKSGVFQPARDFASSGSIYIKTRRPRFKEGSRFAGNVSFRTGSFGLVNPSARFDWKISQRVSATINSEYTYATGRYRFRYRRVYPDGETAWDTTATRRNGDIHAFRLEGALFGHLDGGSWMAKAYYYDSDKGIPGAIVNNVWKNSQRQWDRNFFIQSSWRKSLGERWELQANAKYARDRMRYLNPDTTLMYIDNKFLQQEGYLSVAGRFEARENWDITAAADWQINTLSSSLRDFARPLRNSLLTSVASALDLGELRMRGSLLLTQVFDRTRPEGRKHSSSSLTRFTPALFLAWIPEREELPELRAFVKRAFRMPTFNDLYYTDIGNANLKPEAATQYDLGTTWRTSIPTLLPLIELSADLYFNRVKDKIIAVPKGTGQYRWMMMNIGLTKILGVDFSCRSQWELPAGITGRLRLNYTFQRARDFSDPTDIFDEAGTYKGQIAYIPEHSGSVAAGLQWRGAEINYSWIYVGRRWENSSNILANRVEPWYTHDLSLSYPVTLGKTRLQLTLEVNNLLNQQYEVIKNYPMPGRNFKFIAKWDF